MDTKPFYCDAYVPMFPSFGSEYITVSAMSIKICALVE